jgi:hypothetical protein
MEVPGRRRRRAAGRRGRGAAGVGGATDGLLPRALLGVRDASAMPELLDLAFA